MGEFNTVTVRPVERARAHWPDKVVKKAQTGKMSGGGLRSVSWASVITLVESSVITLNTAIPSHLYQASDCSTKFVSRPMTRQSPPVEIRGVTNPADQSTLGTAVPVVSRGAVRTSRREPLACIPRDPKVAEGPRDGQQQEAEDEEDEDGGGVSGGAGGSAREGMQML